MKLNFYTSLSNTGYGIAGINICRELLKLAEVSIFLPGNGRHDIAFDGADLAQTVQESIKTLDQDAPFVKLWHQFLLTERIGRGKYYGFPIFELNKFNEFEWYNLNIPDELIVCSNWAKTVIEQYLDKVVHVVPLGVDTDIFNPKPKDKNNTYVFYNIGKLEKRKGHDFLPEAFSKAFNKDDNVRLDLMCSNPFLTENDQKQYQIAAKSTKLGDKIKFYPPVPTSKNVADFMNERDCGVFPARAEGWNLELLESMACGKPVITTNYSAHTEYCNDKNSFLIDCVNLEEAQDGKWFFGQGEWMEFDYDQEEQLIEHMRYCYNNRPDNNLGIETAKEYTWKHSANKLLQIIFPSQNMIS